MSANSRGYEFAKRLLHRFTRQHAVLRHHKHSPFCEPLENRMLLSTVTVTGTMDFVDGDTSSIAALIATPGDDGAITLREAVQAANNTEGEDVIEFDQTLAGETITLESDLFILDVLQINGTDVNFEFGQLIVSYAQKAELKIVSNNITLGSITSDNANLVFVAHGSLAGNSVVNPGSELSITAYEVVFTDVINTSGIESGADAGDVTIDTTGIIEINGILANGADSSSSNGAGGDGASIFLASSGDNGTIYIQGSLSAIGGVEGGNGGVFTIITNGIHANITLTGDVIIDTGSSTSQPNGSNGGTSTGSGSASGGAGDNIVLGGADIWGGGYIPGDTVPYGGSSGGGGVTVSDGSGSSNPGYGGTVTVGGSGQSTLNTAPIAHDITGIATENGDAITLAFDATDSNSGDTLTYQFLSQPGNGFVTNLGNGQFRYTPGNWQQLIDGQSRELSFTYRVIDNHGAASEPATVTLTLQGQSDIADGPNAAPVAIPKLVKTDSRTLAMIDVTGNVVDPDGDVVFVWAPDGVSDLGVPLQVGFSGEVFYDPTGYFDGYEVGQRVRDCFTVEVYDAYGNADRTKVFVDVIIAAAPVATLASNGPVVLHSQTPKQICDMAWAPAAELAMVSATVQPVGTTAPGWLQSLLQSGNDDQHVDRLRLMLVEG